MNYLLFSLAVLTLVISTSEGIACYNHYERCVNTPTCIVDENRKNCSSLEQTYCYKDDIFFGMAVRGCAEAAFCNATIFLGTRYCCDTDYCNHTSREIPMTWFMMIIILVITVAIK